MKEFAEYSLHEIVCRATITNQALVNREGTFTLLSASHFTRVFIPITAISSPFYMSMGITYKSETDNFLSILT